MKLKQPITKTYLTTVSVGSDIAATHTNYSINYDTREEYADSRAGYYPIGCAEDRTWESWSKEVKPLTNDGTRDITIRIMDFLINECGWEQNDAALESDWYPFELQDGIHDIINKALEVKE
jgi:hypothetical protein